MNPCYKGSCVRFSDTNERKMLRTTWLLVILLLLLVLNTANAALPGSWPAPRKPPSPKAEWTKLVDLDEAASKAPVSKSTKDCKGSEKSCRWSCTMCSRPEDVVHCPTPGGKRRKGNLVNCWVTFAKDVCSIVVFGRLGDDVRRRSCVSCACCAYVPFRSVPLRCVNSGISCLHSEFTSELIDYLNRKKVKVGWRTRIKNSLRTTEPYKPLL